MAKKQQSEQIEYSHILNKSVLETNDGQLEGLPSNPRFIKDERFAKLKLSLEQSPEFLKARPLLVYPLDNGHFIIIAGNMRFLAGREVGIEEFPCYIFPKETTTDKLKEYLIKDNIAYGSTDWDKLANEDWNVDDLDEWGVNVDFLKDNTSDADIDNLFTEISGAEQKEQITKITVSVPETLAEQVGEITEVIKTAVADYDGVEVK